MQGANIKKRWLGIIIIMLIVAGVIVGLYFLLRSKPADAPLPVVEVQPVHQADVNIYGDYVGRIRAQQFVEVRARVEGYLEKINFEDGSYVHKGQTLFLIDRRVYKAKAEKARAQLNKAKAQALKAERDLARIRPLYEQNAASQLDLDNAEAAYESAKAELSVAQADLTQVELTLGYTVVTSPISGYISARSADIGALIQPDAKTPLAVVVKSDSVLVDFSLTALDYLSLKNRNVNIGEHDDDREWNPYVTVTLADGSPYPFRGLIDFASPVVDPTTGTFSVRAEMPNPMHILLPGEFTKVRVLMDVRANALEVPTKSLEIEKGGAYVYIVKPDSVVERRYVETGPEIGNDIVIERGVARGENVVVEGQHKLRHGMKVAPVLAYDSTSFFQQEKL